MDEVGSGRVPIVFAPTIPADCHARVRVAPHFRRWLAAAAGFDLRRVAVDSVTIFRASAGPTPRRCCGSTCIAPGRPAPGRDGLAGSAETMDIPIFMS
ncbi:hypothetical protein [Gluconacetobacter johannae]|uniref:hypothetical protein n=1 Tax=Gluconacetobacter johannae TaxID=112140 RepID=UPI001C81803D|nr:hypothetical protein [Gluconacetobacter johannae]